MLESSTGSAHCIALAMLDNFTYSADIFLTNRFDAQDLSDPALELHRSPKDQPAVRHFTQLPEPEPERLIKLTQQ